MGWSIIQFTTNGHPKLFPARPPDATSESKKFRRKTEPCYFFHISLSYLFTSFFLFPSSSVIFSLEIYLFMSKKKKPVAFFFRRSEPATFHKTNQSIVKVIDSPLV